MINNITLAHQINVNPTDVRALRNNRQQASPNRPTNVENNLQIVNHLPTPNTSTNTSRVEGVNSLLFEPLYENGFRESARMRGIDEMIKIIEEELSRLDDNTELTDDERVAERGRIENTFFRAVRMHGIRSNNPGGFAMTASDAQSHVQNAATHAFGIIQNIDTFTSEPMIQELINQAMNDFMDFSIRRAASSINFAQRFAASGDDAADETRWRNITSETDNLRSKMQEMVDSMREQMTNMTRLFAIPHQAVQIETTRVNILL